MPVANRSVPADGQEARQDAIALEEVFIAGFRESTQRELLDSVRKGFPRSWRFDRIARSNLQRLHGMEVVRRDRREWRRLDLRFALGGQSGAFRDVLTLPAHAPKQALVELVLHRQLVRVEEPALERDLLDHKVAELLAIHATARAAEIDFQRRLVVLADPVQALFTNERW